MPHENSFRPTPKSGLRWLIVAAKPPTHWLRLSALTTRPCVLARVERGHNVSTNVFYNGEYYRALRTIARSSPRRSCEALATVASCPADASSNPTDSPRGA